VILSGSDTIDGAYSRERVLVTGGAGAIGANLIRRLLGAGAQVLVLDDLSASTRWNLPRHPGLTFLEGDVLDPDLLGRAFDGAPSIVFHLAALFANQNSVEHPEEDLQVNGLGTLRVFRGAAAAGVRRVVFASSGCSIYGDRPERPLTEDLVSLRLSTPYQVTKMLGELYAQQLHQQVGLPVVVARLFNSFGPWDPPGRYRNVIPNFFWQALHGLPLPITGTGAETRDFTYVDDVVDGLLRCGVVEGVEGEAFNIASGRETRIGDLAARISALTGNAAGISSLPRRGWDTKTSLLASVDKGRARLGYAPRWTVEPGLERTLGWFREHWPRLADDPRFRPPTLARPRPAAVSPAP
jgi:UDP-glucose 4-epimerase